MEGDFEAPTEPLAQVADDAVSHDVSITVVKDGRMAVASISVSFTSVDDARQSMGTLKEAVTQNDEARSEWEPLPRINYTHPPENEVTLKFRNTEVTN